MNKDDAIAALRLHAADLKQKGVKSLYMFGSTARGEARPDSDVDLFFDYDETNLTLYGLIDIKEAAAHILGRKTHNPTRDSLDPQIRPRTETDAICVS